jgi:hypothetical protein
LFVVDFNTAARDSRTYPEYEHKLANGQVSYLGIAIRGAARVVTSIAGNSRAYVDLRQGKFRVEKPLNAGQTIRMVRPS